jgi:hypothetical protein
MYGYLSKVVNLTITSALRYPSALYMVLQKSREEELPERVHTIMLSAIRIHTGFVYREIN